MAPTIAYTLPMMQLVCNLVMPGEPDLNISYAGLTATQPPPQIPSTTLLDGYVVHPEIGVAYKLYTERHTWQGAKEKCILEGGHLPVIDSHLKFDHVMNQTASVASIHVGIHSLYDDAIWVSATTGLPISSIPWAPNDPSGGHDCVRTSTSPRGLRNYPCADLANIVCELPIPVAGITIK